MASPDHPVSRAVSAKPTLQISLRDCPVQAGGKLVLRVSQWSLRRGERWLLEGVNGSGKSALLRLLAGHEWPMPEAGAHQSRRYHFDGMAGWSPLRALQRVALLNPEFQNRYLAQDWELTAAEVVATGFENTVILHQRPGDAQLARLREMLLRLGLETLAHRPFLDLSQGERRKVLIARALVRAPEVLLLDEFLEGLDPAAQENFAHLLGQAPMRGTSVVLTTHRPLRQDMAGWRCWRIERGQARERRDVTPSVPGLAREEHALLSGWQEGCPAPKPDRPLHVAIRSGTFFIGERLLLEDFDWEIAAGEHWVLLGANGSGKTSLLRLLWGDLHLAFGGEMRRFGRAGLTVHQIRRRSGLFLPDFHGLFLPHQTGLQVVLSGFFASVGLLDRPSAEQCRVARDLAEELHLADLLDRPLGQMSYGQARRILLARALVHQPEMILLDEPFDGLDRSSRRLVANLLESVVARDGVTVVLSSHHLEDMPPWVRRAALLNGRRLRFFRRAEGDG